MSGKSKKTVLLSVLILIILVALFLAVTNKFDIPIKYLLAILPNIGDGGGGYQDTNPPAVASCVISANPDSGFGPFDSQITVTFSDLPSNTVQALIQCNTDDPGINVPINNTVATRTCSYPHVMDPTFFNPKATAGTAVCQLIITDNPQQTIPVPLIILTGPAVSGVTQTNALVSWTTNNLSDSTVKYSTTAGQYALQGHEATLTQDHSVALSGLQPQTTYYYIVKSEDSNGNIATSNESSFTTLSIVNNDGGGTSYTPPAGLSSPQILINEGADFTPIKEVVLTLSVNGNVSEMLISNNETFAGVNWESFSMVKPWTLLPGIGNKNVYVKFMDADYNISDVAWDGIYLSEDNELNTTSTSTVSSTGSNSNSTSTDIVLEETTSTNSTSTLFFLRNLYFGIRGDDVKILQKFLNYSNFKLTNDDDYGAPGRETNFFGPLTRMAVTKFQEAHFEDILKPLNLTKGTGFLGIMTRNFINSLKLTNIFQ